MTITVLIVDDHAGFRRMVRRMLEVAGFDVIGEAADGADALRRVAELQPDLLLLDIQLPDLDGIAVCRRVTEAGHDVMVVLTSSRSITDYGSRLSHCGARGFLPKEELSGPALLGLLGVAS